MASTTDTVTWTPTIAATQAYRLYAKWRAHGSHASNAKYTVHHAGGSTVVTKDQRYDGGQWNYLGTFTLAPGANHRIELNGGGNGYVIADAVALEADATAAPNVATWVLPVASAGDYRLYARWPAAKFRTPPTHRSPSTTPAAAR